MRRSRAAASGGTVQGRSGNDIGSLGLSGVGVDVEVNAGVAVAVGTRE